MQYSDFRYIDSALRGKESRNDVMTLDAYIQVLTNPQNHIGESRSYVNRFRSWCRFNETYEKHWLSNLNKKGNSSIGKYKGSHIFDYLFWDVDSESIAEAVRLQTELFEHVDKKFGLSFDHFVLWISGGKGFHPYLPAGIFQPWPHDLNEEAAPIFTDKIFPEGWVKKHQLGGHIDPTTIKDLNRLCREGGSLNFKEGREKNGYKVGITEEQWNELKTDPELYFEFSKEPTKLFLSTNCLTGEHYWKFAEIKQLSDLWKESLQQAIEKKEGKKVIQTGFNNNTGVSFYMPENLEIPQCIRNMHKALQTGEVKIRHGVFMVLTAFYARFLPQNAVLALISSLNASLSDSKSDDEIKKIVDDVFERGYRTGCGNPNGELGQTCLLYCNERASLDECPKHKTEEGGLIAQRSAGVYTAYTRLNANLKQGISPITLGIPEWDTPIGEGHKKGQMITFCGYSQTAKTLMNLRVAQHQVKIAKSLNEFILFFTPEGSNEDIVEKIIKQRGRMNKKEMYEHAGNGGFNKELTDWLLEYEDTLVSVRSAFFSVEDIEKAIQYHQKRLGKRIMTVIIDGVVFTSMTEAGRFQRPDEQVAKYLHGLCVDTPFLAIYNLHVEKAGAGNVSNDKPLREQVPKATAGFGTGHYHIASDFYIVCYRDGDNIIWRVDKFRGDYDGTPPPDKIKFKFFRPHYMAYSESEILALGSNHFTDPRIEIMPSPEYKFDIR